MRFDHTVQSPGLHLVLAQQLHATCNDQHLFDAYIHILQTIHEQDGNHVLRWADGDRHWLAKHIDKLLLPMLVSVVDDD